MKPETKSKIILIEQRLSQTYSTLQTWTGQITHYRTLLEQLTKQLKEIKSQIKNG